MMGPERENLREGYRFQATEVYLKPVTRDP
jgi:hypothetical protein